MRRAVILLSLLAGIPAGESLVADHRTVALAEAIPAEVLDQVRSRRTVLLVPPGRSPLAAGLQDLAKTDPRFRLRSERAPMASWYKDGGTGLHQGSTSLRTDTKVREFARTVDRLAGNLDVAAMHLGTSDLPDNGRIEAPVRQFTAGMEINVSSVNLAGTMTETLRGTQVIDGGGATLFTPGLEFPLELPNVGLGNLRTQSRVPAGLAADDPGWQVSDSRSPRDPRRAWDDYRQGMEQVAASHPKLRLVWTTIPLAKDGNIQRNLVNQWIREHCRKTGRDLLDIADIQASDAEGVPAWDRQGYRLADAWRDAEGGRDAMAIPATQRIAKAWWWLNARMSGWQPESAANDVPN